MNEEIVVVNWLDPSYGDDEMTLADAIALEPCSMTTVGFLLADTPDKLVLAGTVMPDGYRSVLCVPRAVVVKMETLSSIS